MTDSGVWMGDFDIDLIFYVVLGVCAILLALGAIVSAVRLARAERLLKIQDRAGYELAHVAPSVRQERVSLDAALMSEPVEEAVIGSEASSLVNTPRKKAAGSFFATIWTYLNSFGRSFSGKMFFTFTGIIAAFGLLTAAVVYFKLSASLTGYAVRRARVLAVNVGDNAPAYLLKKNPKGLRELLRKLANSPGVAYALVEDRKGNIFAHSFVALPQEVQSAQPTGVAKSDEARILRLGEGLVYEVSVPISEGQVGAVRVALWKAEVDADVSATVIPLIKLIGLIILAGMVLAVFFVWRITHPILRLVRTARRISLGDLDTPTLGVGDPTEFGELSRALERIRSSVKAALVRLHQER